MKAIARLKDKIRATAFYAAYLQILSLGYYNWLVVLLDILSILSVYAILSLSGLFFNVNTFALIRQSLGPFSNHILIFSMIIYVALLIFSVSFFRYSIMDIIVNKLKTKLDLKGISKLYFLNLLIFSMVIIFLTVSMNILRFILREDFYSYFRDFVAVVTILIYYLAYNLTVTNFFINKQAGIYYVIKSMFNTIFSRKLWKLFSGYMTFIIFLGTYVVVYFISNAIAALTAFRDSVLYLKYYPSYISVFAWIAYLFMYFGIYFNRFYFINIIKKTNKGQK